MEKHKSPKPRKTGVDLGLSAEEKERLREVAFQAIRRRCLGESMPDTQVEAPRLKEPGAAFVCIHKGKDLRGCIGMIEARAPLWETVRKMAVEAAFGDPRFCALATDELDKIDIEISVLTPMRRISDPAEIEVGKHGLFIRRGLRSGLLLPQVATEHNWDREQFLKWTCHKAGLPEKAWKDKDVEVYVFSADVF
jgi:AmmeMemoRadiSam system protein A